MELKTIITCFAGRKDYMEIQLRYVIKLLEKYDFIERYDIWDFAWTKEDSDYLKTLPQRHPKIHLKRAPNSGQYSLTGNGCSITTKQFAHFYHDAYSDDKYRDYIFLKIDDDVVYMDVDNFEALVQLRKRTDNYFLVSANVINNYLNIPDPTTIHQHFLETYQTPARIGEAVRVIEYPNQLRLSINFCMWLGQDLPLIQQEFSNGEGLNDEWRMCHDIAARAGKHNLIAKDYLVSHFSFGTQRFDKNTILNKYRTLCNTIT